MEKKRRNIQTSKRKVSKLSYFFSLYEIILNIYNKKVKFPQNNIDDISLVKDHRSYNLSKNSEISMLEEEENLDRIFKLIKNSEDPRVEKIFKMRYKNGKKLTPWKKIAKKLDLSIQGCINIHNKHLTEIKKYV